MSDALVQELQMMAAYLERFGKIEEARYIRQVIDEYCRDHADIGFQSETGSDQCGEQTS